MACSPGDEVVGRRHGPPSSSGRVRADGLGASESFATLGAEALRVRFRGESLNRSEDEAVETSEQMLPAGWACVRLAGCPVRLSLRQDEHLDELIRELQLVGANRANPISGLVLELQDLLSGPAHARHMGRRIAQRAAAEGREFIDVDMAMPREFSAEVQQLDMAVKAADVLCEKMRLLTLASSGDLRALRA